MSSDSPEVGSHPASFFAARAALAAIEEAVRTARASRPEDPPGAEVSSDQVLSALLLLREMRDELAGWETALIETAREAGASWAELAHPLGVSSRQAAERRYLRLRPGAPGTTGDQRVQATRERRAADRALAAWARENAADLRQLAGQIMAVDTIPSEARDSLTRALGGDDAAGLIDPLADTRGHLTADDAELADRVDGLIRRTGRFRRTGAGPDPTAPDQA
ncbi:type III effector protein [Streptomyces sp. NPDC006367]|uniref:type III effector protein n=1 Tax=unclassified Streptomyces TaxID=2593676 RepID=UPI0033B275FE